MSLRQAAALAGIDTGQLSRVERGQSGLSVDSLARLAGVLGLVELTRLLEPYRRDVSGPVNDDGPAPKKGAPRRPTT
jgi:transcriptional regulator with XRE-family HTH domain